MALAIRSKLSPYLAALVCILVLRIAAEFFMYRNSWNSFPKSKRSTHRMFIDGDIYSYESGNVPVFRTLSLAMTWRNSSLPSPSSTEHRVSTPRHVRLASHIPRASDCSPRLFEPGLVYSGPDYLRGSLDEPVPTAEACCRRCAELPACTHWGWSAVQSVCSIQQGRLWRSPNPPLAEQTAGRVALDLYVERIASLQPPVVGHRSRAAPCKHSAEDAPFFTGALQKRSRSYIVLNEPRSGSSWLQEISQTHPGIKVQFELALAQADGALACQECARPLIPDSKRAAGHLPPRRHPPLACGATLFGSANAYTDVASLAARHEALFVVLLRVNHVAHAISSYRHFNRPTLRSGAQTPASESAGMVTVATRFALEGRVPWDAGELSRAVEEARQGYARLLQFPGRAGRPAHLIFYEDLKRHPAEVWAALQRFLGLPAIVTGGLNTLERKASNRPSIDYLQELQGLQEELRGEDWRDMLLDPNYDEAVNVTEAFAEACRLHPAGRLSWRGHNCLNGTLVELDRR